jgi:hypothetical protein
LIAARVQAIYESTDGQRVTAGAMFEDISPAGGCIRLGTPLPVGSQLGIQWLAKVFQVRVVYCRADGMDYVIGFQKAEDQAPWPTERRRQNR